jgi:hypothetical protein
VEAVRAAAVEDGSGAVNAPRGRCIGGNLPCAAVLPSELLPARGAAQCGALALAARVCRAVAATRRSAAALWATGVIACARASQAIDK